MAGILILASVLAAVASFFFLTEATMGVGIVGYACFLGILARIAQAQDNHEAQQSLITKVQREVKREARKEQAIAAD